MKNLLRVSAGIALALAGMTARMSGAPAMAPDGDTKPEVKQEMKPDVAALLRQSTDAYKKMKTYRQTANWVVTGKTEEGKEVRVEIKFTLALDRPNRFCYKMDTVSPIFPTAAAVCDGVNFTNFKGKVNQYMKIKAPETYRGINIVDDVEFQPIATYLIALMLQGDALADKDVRSALSKATLRPPVTEGGKKWQVLEAPFFSEGKPIEFYFNAEDHLLGKAVQRGDERIVETVESVKIDKPVEAAVFQYAPPADAKKVDRFTGVQRPNDARLNTGKIRVAHR